MDPAFTLRRLLGRTLTRLRLKSAVLRLRNYPQERRIRTRFPITKPLDRADVAILGDQDFQRSVSEVRELTLLDTARLANLWQFCRATDPAGAMLEVGSFKGGGALHLSNCCPGRQILACDSFQSFEAIDPALDGQFRAGQFSETSYKQVAALFSSRKRPAGVYPGFFPASVKGLRLPRISFVHLDADVYKATRESLDYLLDCELLLPRSLIVLDDYMRGAQGVDRAVAETLTIHPEWACFPVFPGQGLLIPASYLASASSGQRAS